MASRSGHSKESPAFEVPDSGSSSSSRPRAASRAQSASSFADPVLRNAIRYTVSAREYESLHKYVLSRSRLLRRRVPTVGAVGKYMNGAGDDGARGKGKGRATASESSPSPAPSPKGADTYNVRAVRHALRLFITTGLGMKLYNVIVARLRGQKEYVFPVLAQRAPGGVVLVQKLTNLFPPACSLSRQNKKGPLYKSPTLRLSLSLSTILLLYRLLFRFLSRMRAHLLDPSAEPFRTRNPRTAQTLTSPYAPAVGASLAGLALGIYPAGQVRVSVAIYTLFRALEFGWNLLEDDGAVWGWKAKLGGKGLTKRERPWWFGSWMLQPFAFGQLLHATVFDRDCAPVSYIDFIWKGTSEYLHSAPKDLPAGVKWPTPWDVADSLAQMAKLNWPPYISPTLFPNQETLPASLAVIAPLTSRAHPLMTSLSCATLHPADPSCIRTYVSFWLRSFPRMGRFFLVFYSLLMLPRYKALYHAPLTVLTSLLARTLRLSGFVTGAISTAWASICLFQAWLPRTFLPTQRFFFGGFLAGLWGFIERKQGRSVFLYSARTSIDSLWKVGVKRRWWKAMQGGDLWVFVLALAITGAVYEKDVRAIREGNWRKGVSWVRGTSWRDWEVEEVDEQEEGAEDAREI